MQRVTMNASAARLSWVVVAVVGLVGCDQPAPGLDGGMPDDAPTADTPDLDAYRIPLTLGDEFREGLANPAPSGLTEGEWHFYRNTWNSEVDGLPPEFLVELWQGDTARWGEQFSAYGFVIDPTDDLPLGLERGTEDPNRTGQTCALCHVARLEDGRVWTGFAAVDLRLNAWKLDIEDAWIAAGNPARYSEAARARLMALPQPGIDSVTDESSPYLAPVDFPHYLNFGRRGLFGSDGAARDARSAILVSIFGFRGSMNPIAFPDATVTGPFVDFLVQLETPRSMTMQDTALVTRGRAVFEEASCSACHNPDMQTEERVIEWVEDGPELLPGVDAAHPNGTIATDGERFQMTSFSGGVDEGQMAFARFIVRQRLRVGMSNGYIPRDIHAVFGSAPYLHNGSVPTLYDLLLPAAERPTTFENRGVTVDTSTPGMSNEGHEFGTTLSADDRTALVAYLMSL